MNKRLESLFCYFPERLKKSLNTFPNLSGLEEIRIRIGKPVMLMTSWGEEMLRDHTQLYLPSMEDCQSILENITRSSFYAYQEDIKNGFITVEGGHRIGIGGTGVLRNGTLHTLKDISFLNIRLASEHVGISDEVMEKIYAANTVQNTLIISPPQAGKTTLLRDITRNLSNHARGEKIVLIDERGELAAVYHGIPQNDIGIRTDVLTGVPKAEGMLLAIRSLSPTVLITDELGSAQEIDAAFRALHSGVKLITTVHGATLQEILAREDLKPLFHHRIFQVFILIEVENERRKLNISDGGEWMC